MIHKIFSIIGGGVGLFSLFLCIAAVGDLMDPNETDPGTGTLIGLLVFFGGIMSASGYLCVSQWKRAKTGTVERTERNILRMIAARSGRITPEEIALEQPLTVEQARARLDALCGGGSGEVQVTPEGRLVYVFFGFLSEEERNSARSVLE
ncbi:MAG: hypothetical protein ACLFRG_10545 [Desulfococcaceae bacterium]